MIPIGLVLGSQSPNLGMNLNSIQSSDGSSMFGKGLSASSLLTSKAIESPEKFGGTSSSENIISISGFDQLLQSVIGNTKTKRRSFTKKRR